jgi:Homeodomain
VQFKRKKEYNEYQNSDVMIKWKSALANKLNLLSHQVEVWFQNRKARRELKSGTFYSLEAIITEILLFSG